LNVSIVEMVKKPDVVEGEDLMHEVATTILPDGVVNVPSSESSVRPLDELLIGAEGKFDMNEPATTPEARGRQAPTDSGSKRINETTTEATQTDTQEDGLRFPWSKQEVNTVLGAFYVGHGLGILFSGSFVEQMFVVVVKARSILAVGMISEATMRALRQKKNVTTISSHRNQPGLNGSCKLE
jgi:hypothetical protein